MKNAPDSSPTDKGNHLFADYLTLAEMAEAAGISERTLARWHNLRIGPPRTRVGRRIHYHIPTVRAWLAAQQEDVAKRGRSAA